jgi:hypothetical protein
MWWMRWSYFALMGNSGAGEHGGPTRGLAKLVKNTRFRFEKIYLKPNRFRGGEEWRNTVEGGWRQRNISKEITRVIGLVEKTKKK